MLSDRHLLALILPLLSNLYMHRFILASKVFRCER